MKKHLSRHFATRSASVLMFASLSALALLVGSLDAQTRSSFVYHVYVDPIHGDDRAAYRMNPHPSGGTWDVEFGSPNDLLFNLSRPALDIHPGTGEVQGNVIHAPYPFKTITQIEGALRYVSTRVASALPSTYAISSSQTVTLTHVIVHCLPGLYGPTEIGPGSDTDAASGLTFNGETFPIVMQHRVSLQGASALDTILDARGWRDTFDGRVGRNAIVAFVNNGGDFAQTFIDSFTIRNNTLLNTNPENHWGDGSGAGIYIGGEATCRPTISNNFIVSNVVGIALESDTSAAPPTGVQQPVIVNNTIARNLPVGANGGFQIWSGDRAELNVPNTVDNLNYGRGVPLIYNNILDAPGALAVAWPPNAGGVPVVSCGVHWDDMIVRQNTLMGAPPTPVTINFNAFQALGVWGEVVSAANHQTRYTIPTASTLTWPVSAIQTGLTFPNLNTTPPTNVLTRVGTPPGVPAFVPRVNIAPWTPASGAGTLYIADLFRNYLDVGLPLALRRCQHDFRMAPMVRLPAGAVSTPNPLIGSGINLSLDGSPNSAGNVVVSFSFAAIGAGPLRTVTGPVGIPAHPQDYPSAAKHEWDFDAEGFGNPRFHVHSGINPASPFGDVDLGADEVDELIMSGYLNGTRIFSQTHPVGTVTVGLLTRCQNPYYFGLAGSTFNRPNYTFYEGLVQEWYRAIRFPGLTPLDDLWTHPSLMPTALWTDTAPGGPALRPPLIAGRVQPGIPRSQWCDYGALLLPDPKPWGYTSIPLFNFPYDLYCTNPWYNNLNSAYAQYDNPHAYWNSFAPVPPPAGGNNFWGVPYTQPFTSIVSPPGTMQNDVSLTSPTPPPWLPYPWTLSHLDVPTFVSWLVQNIPFGHWTNPSASTTFDPWGVGDSGLSGTSIDVVPYNVNRPYYGLRINCEGSTMIGDPRTNVQTFLIVQGPPPPGGATARAPGVGPLFSPPTLDPKDRTTAQSRIQAYIQSKELREALQLRQKRIDRMRGVGK